MSFYTKLKYALMVLFAIIIVCGIFILPDNKQTTQVVPTQQQQQGSKFNFN